MATLPLLVLEERPLYHEPLQTVQVPMICILPLLHLRLQAGHKAKELTVLLLPVLILDLFSNSAQFHLSESGVYKGKYFL